MGLIAAVVLFVASAHPFSGSSAMSELCTSTASAASAAEHGTYGEKKAVATVRDAERVLKRHFAKKDVYIGEIVEKELYFEAEISDSSNSIIDRVIVDKRTGRIRSIY